MIGADDHLRKFPRIDDLEELRNYPNLQALKITYKQEIDSNVPFGQFAVYVAKFIKPKQRPLPIVYGWNDQDFVPDAETSKDSAKDLVEFSKLQWTIFASRQAHHESETDGEDREVCLPHATASISLPDHTRPYHEQFGPNLGKPARGDPYGKDQGGKGQHRDKGQGQSKGKDKQGTKSNGRCDLSRLCGADWMEPGLPVHLVLEPATWVVLALELSM